MPNHVTNILRVSGDPEKVSAMFEAIKNDEIGLGSIDFNKVIPMPNHIFQGNLGMAERVKYGKDNWYDCYAQLCITVVMDSSRIC